MHRIIRIPYLVIPFGISRFLVFRFSPVPVAEGVEIGHYTFHSIGIAPKGKIDDLLDISCVLQGDNVFYRLVRTGHLPDLL